MRRLDLLITQSRRNTENEDFSDTRGILTEEFIEYLNAGQERIQALIQVEFADVFQAEKVINAVAGQEIYSLPSDTFLGIRIDMVEYSSSGGTDEYYTIKKASKRERTSGFTADPSFYIRRNKEILLQPAPDTNGKIRVTYQKRLPKLDIRRGTVDSTWVPSSELNTTTNTFINNRIVLDSTTSIDKTELLEENFISIVDKNGNIKMKNIPIDDIDALTGIVTVTSGFVYETGETISSGDYAVRGTESTTHSQLPDNVERYLVAYSNWKIFKRDSSVDSTEAQAELLALETDIVESFSVPDADVNYIPILDDQFLGSEGDT